MRLVLLLTAASTATLAVSVFWYFFPVTATDNSHTHRHILSSVVAGNPLELDVLNQGSTYHITLNEINHLQDVESLLKIIYISLPLLIVKIITNKNKLRVSLFYEFAIIILASFAIIFSFNHSFIALHHIVFPRGNWSFPLESLLISTYPIHIWRNIAIIWLITTTIVYILLLSYTKK